MALYIMNIELMCSYPTLVQSDAIKCWHGDVADGKTNAEGVEILKEKDCDEGITMCKNYTATASKKTF